MFGRNKDDDDASLGLGTGLEPGADVPSGNRITALDIQQRQFSSQRKGYSEAEVDEFLDQITEEMVRLSAESKRSGGGSGDGNAAAVAEAELIRRKAREDAEAILADARARAAVMGSGQGGSTSASTKAEIQAFLNQEREFLHSIAGLVQGHAATITGMAKEARAAGASSSENSSSSSSERSSDPATESAPERSAESTRPRTSSPATPSAGTSAWAATSESSTSVATVQEEIPEVSGQGTTASVVQIPPSDVDAPSANSEPIQAEVTSTIEASAQSDGPAPQGDDRSLRELFWGED